MSTDNAAQGWEPADDLDRILYEVWCAALDASTSKDMQQEIHDCPACGDPHSQLDEAKYLEMQRVSLTRARRHLDGMIG